MKCLSHLDKGISYFFLLFFRIIYMLQLFLNHGIANFTIKNICFHYNYLIYYTLYKLKQLKLNILFIEEFDVYGTKK